VNADLCQKGPSIKGFSMRKLSALTFVLSLVLGASAAFAQPKDKAPAGGAGKVKVYDFSGDTIEGDLIKPEGTDVGVADFGKHSSLIKIRKDFIPEILKSAEDL